MDIKTEEIYGLREELRTLHEEYQTLEAEVDNIKRIANNVLYFNDSSDYGSALYDILQAIDPEFDDDNLEYIEQALNPVEKGE